MTFQRFTIYWAPERDSALAAFGRSWFGFDPETGAESGTLDAHGLESELFERATVKPARYGLHGTIKAPFRMRHDATRDALMEALAGFCARRRRITCGPLRLHRFPRHLALIPDPPRSDLEWLASDCVAHFNQFRAPLSDEDRARRRADALGHPERALFEQFGYPYIFAGFFFHLTLAGPLEETELARVEEALRPALAPVTEQPFQFDALCLFGDPGEDRKFRLVSRVPLMR